MGVSEVRTYNRSLLNNLLVTNRYIAGDFQFLGF